MDYIQLSGSPKVLNGLERMLDSAEEGLGSLTESTWISVDNALLIVEIAKRSEDTAEFFPHGKWATIQAIQDRVDAEIDKLFDGKEVKK